MNWTLYYDEARPLLTSSDDHPIAGFNNLSYGDTTLEMDSVSFPR
jgi:hypothetical protein